MGMDVNTRHPVNQLDRVICQIRFPALLEVNKRVDEFQKLIRRDYPGYTQPEPPPMNLANVPFPIDHRFQSDDKVWTVTLSVEAISLTTTHYTDWNDFKTRFESLMSVILGLFEIDSCVRVGLRYINAIRPSSVGMSDVKEVLREPYSELVKVDFGQLRGSNLILDYDLDNDTRGRSKISSIQFIDGEMGILIDDDTFIEKEVSIKELMPILDRLNGKSLEVFINIASKELVSKVVG